jgi:hypothetical protein
MVLNARNFKGKGPKVIEDFHAVSFPQLKGPERQASLLERESKRTQDQFITTCYCDNLTPSTIVTLTHGLNPHELLIS